MKATFIRRITLAARAMTTRKRRGVRVAAAVTAMALGSALGGCATPGPLHVYTVASPTAAMVNDRGDSDTHDVASFLAPGEELIGFAYDPFTDHFFLRLAPGNRVRVVDRPARAIKREFKLAGVGAPTAGPFAVRPRDGHLFVLTRGARVVELTRFGEHVRDVWLSGVGDTPRGIACDAARDLLLVLAADGRRITRHQWNGTAAGDLTLDRAVGGPLAFDAARREFYAPLADDAGVAVFGDDGRFIRALPMRARFVDVGERSLLRMF